MEEKADIIQNINLLSKQVISDIVSNAVAKVMDGTINPLSAMVQLKGLKTIVADIEKQVEELAMTESYRYNEPIISAYNAYIQRVETGVKYDYSVSSEWQRLEAQREEIRKLQKPLEDRIKTASEKSPFYDADGTEITSNGKSSKTSLKIKFK